jgi:hypothetical protein
MKRFIFLYIVFINGMVASEKQSTVNSDNNSNEKNSSGCVAIPEQLNLFGLSHENNDKENKQPASLLLKRRSSFKSNPEENKDKYVTLPFVSNNNMIKHKENEVKSVFYELKQSPEIITITKSKNGELYKEALEWLVGKVGGKNVLIEYNCEEVNYCLKQEQQKSPRKFSSDL